MKMKVGQHSELIESAKEKMASEEEERRKLRFQHSLKELSEGHLQVMESNEFVTGLADHLISESDIKSEDRNALLSILGEGALGEDVTMRERVLAILSPVAEFLISKDDESGLLVLADIFGDWLEYEDELLPGFSVINKRIGELLQWLLQNSNWVEAEKLLLVLNQIQTGSLKKISSIKSLVCKTLSTLESKEIIEKLTNEYLLETAKQQVVQNILLSLGQKAVIYQLNRVIHSHDRRERLALINLIPVYGNLAVPVLVECLEKDPPWAVVRNIIYIVSEIGSDSNYHLVEKYFRHYDERVQHEMICCVMKNSQKERTSRLIEALELVKDRLKIHIIRLLVEEEERDQAIFSALCGLAEKRKNFSRHSGFELLKTIVAALKNYPCPQSAELLAEMYADYDNNPASNQAILQIGEALKVIEPQVRHNIQNFGGFKDAVSFDTDPVQGQLTHGKVRKIEEEIQNLVGAGKMQQAGQFVYSQAVSAARARDFSVAEKLRDRLLEISPTALSEVIGLGELIEEQKSSSITTHHIEIWSELYEEMSTEEFNALYYALRQENYSKGEIIVNSGETDTYLYFLNSGFISLSCLAAGNEVFLKRMQPGDILGSEQFFSASVWTVTLKALSEVQVQVLNRSALAEISRDYPEIENTLRNYCEKFTQVPELLKMSGDDRREFPRYSGSLLTRNILLDPYGNRGKRSFKGELIDVSQGGLAFTIRISNKSNARLLLGRQIVSTINVGDEELPQCNGVIVGVRIHDPIEQDFSVHVKLFKKIGDVSFKRILSLVD